VVVVSLTSARSDFGMAVSFCKLTIFLRPNSAMQGDEVSTCGDIHAAESLSLTLDTSLIWCDGSALSSRSTQLLPPDQTSMNRVRHASTHLDTDSVLQDSLGSVGGDLIIGLISVFHSKIIVLDVEVEEGGDELSELNGTDGSCPRCQAARVPFSSTGGQGCAVVDSVRMVDSGYLQVRPPVKG